MRSKHTYSNNTNTTTNLDLQANQIVFQKIFFANFTTTSDSASENSGDMSVKSLFNSGEASTSADAIFCLNRNKHCGMAEVVTSIPRLGSLVTRFSGLVRAGYRGQGGRGARGWEGRGGMGGGNLARNATRICFKIIKQS